MIKDLLEINKELTNEYYNLIQLKVGTHPTLHNLPSGDRVPNSINNISKDKKILQSNIGWVPLYDKYPFIKKTLLNVKLDTISLRPLGNKETIYMWEINITPLGRNFIIFEDDRRALYKVKKYETKIWNTSSGPRETKNEVGHDQRIIFESIDEAIKEILYRLDIGKEW